MNYEEMSDFEINWKVAEHLGLLCIHERGGSVCYQMQFGGSCMVDYCNNPSDAWSIMHSNGIATVSENGVIIGATSNSQSFYDPDSCSEISCFNQNPLRAAMIVFLMMRDEQCQKK